MDYNDLKRFSILIAVLQEIFIPNKPLSKERIQIYFDFLSDLSITQIEGAVSYIIKNKIIPTFPTIGEIRTATLGSMEHRAVKAWGELLDKTYNINKKFKDSLVLKVARIAFGRLENFYEGNPRNEMADRAHFIRTFQLIANLEEAKKEKKKALKEVVKGYLKEP